MPSLVVPNAVLVRLIWSLAGTPYAVNVLGGRKVSATTIDQGFANTLGAAIKGAFTGTVGVATVISNQVSLANVGVRDIASPNRPEFIDSGAAVLGTGTGDLLPLQTAICTTLRTDQAGKSFRGRFYMCGFTETSNSPLGVMTGGVGGVPPAFLGAVKTAMTSSGLALAVISRKNLVATDVTVIQVRDSIWDTIRKRAVPGV